MRWQSPSSVASARRRLLTPAFLCVAGLGGLLGAPSTHRAAASQAGDGCPERLVRHRSQGTAWEADPDLERLVHLLADDAWIRAPMPGIADSASWHGATVRLARDLACADPEAPGADWVAGAAWPERGFVVVRAGDAVGAVTPVRRVLRHEFAHLAMHRATNGRAPRWLDEGYAQLVAGEWGWEQGWTLRLAFLRGHASLSELSLRFPGYREGAAAAYLLSYTAVEQLLSLGGEPGLRALFVALADGSSLDDAVRRVYGLTADQFEARWRRAVSGRYGTLYVLSRAAVFWIGVTLLVLWVGGRRRRRDRARLERMRREELEAAAAELPLEIMDDRV